MTKVALWIIAVLIPFMTWYVIWGRTWLSSKPWMAWFYRSTLGEWAEIHLFKKSETVLWGRFLQFVGYATSTVLLFGDIDMTPLVAILPARLQWIPPLIPILVSLAGHIQVQLRKDTRTPLEVVALPEAAKHQPEVAAAIENLDKAKVEAAVAVAVVKEASIAAGNVST